MKHLTYVSLALILMGTASCLRPTEECDYTVNRPECDNCCVQNNMEYYDWDHLDQECYCK